jgi:hypothetical protein
MSKYRTEYIYRRLYGAPHHEWRIIGAAGAMHLHATEPREPESQERPHGGLEVHHRHPPEYRKHDAPDFDECHILKTPCWCDGSSLALDDYLPYFRGTKTDHEFIFKKLESDYEAHFVNVEEEVSA